MSNLILFATDGCHLCEQAQQLIFSVLGRTVAEVDIADRPDLLDRYAVRIPVLRRVDSGEELDWPFAAADVSALAGNLPFESSGF